MHDRGFISKKVKIRKSLKKIKMTVKYLELIENDKKLIYKYETKAKIKHKGFVQIE